MLILLLFFLQSLSRLNANYKNFFDGGSREDSDGSKKGVENGDGFADSWGWWSLVDALTNSRVDKWDQILDWEVIKALNVCCYYKDKQRMEDQQHRDMMQKAKHGR